VRFHNKPGLTQQADTVQTSTKRQVCVTAEQLTGSDHGYAKKSHAKALQRA